ncbi:MAG: DUF1294 domain-containing protein [Mycoplasmatota bacterium]
MKCQIGIFSLIILNLISFIVFYIDKRKAIKRKRRISEKTLIKLSIFGTTGALLSMYLFRHKTKKNKFVITLPLILITKIMIFNYFL